jgi:hypothetical protein
VPPACGKNTQCAEFWRNPWVTNLFGCTPEECPTKYGEASLVDRADALPASFIANATDEIVPLSQAERLEAAVRSGGTATQLDTVSGTRHAQTYLESVWNDTIAFLAEGIGVEVPEPVDFSDSLVDRGWVKVALLAAVVGVGVAVVARIRGGRSRGAAS